MLRTTFKTDLILSLAAFIIFNYISYSYAQNTSNEYRIKAALIYKIMKMVSWPNEKNNPNGAWYLCFLGEDTFGNMLDSIEHRIVRKQKLILRRNVTLNEVEDCHLLFISRSEQNYLTQILSKIEQLPILTIGDVDKFAQQGGMINLLKKRGRIQIEINNRAAREANLRINPRFLTLASIVER